MHVFEFPEISLKIKAPSQVDECSASQYFTLLNLYHQLIAAEINILEFKNRLAYHFLNLKPAKKAKNVGEQHPKAVNLFRCAEMFDSFLEIKGNHTRVNINTIKQFFPTIKYAGKKYTGAATALTTFSFIQFIHAEAAYSKYTNQQDPEQLNLLAAIIYQPLKPWYTFNRQADDYNAATTERTANHFKNLPIEYKMAALNLFQSTLEWWNSGPIELNGIDVDLRILFKGSGKKGTNFGFTGVLNSMAETGVFGNIEKTAKANLYDVLFRLYQVSIQNKESEKAQS